MDTKKFKESALEAAAEVVAILLVSTVLHGAYVLGEKWYGVNTAPLQLLLVWVIVTGGCAILALAYTAITRFFLPYRHISESVDTA